MKDQRMEENRQQIISEKEKPTKAEKRRSPEGDWEPGVARIKLPMNIGAKVKDVVAELKGRGAQVTLDELLLEYIEAIPESYFEEQLLKRTPEPYYLDAAIKVPELRELLIRQAKKGLMKLRGEGLPQPLRRAPRKKAEKDEADSAGESSNASH